MGLLEVLLAALSSFWAQKNPGEENLMTVSPVGREVEKRESKEELEITWSTPRCEDWGILGN